MSTASDMYATYLAAEQAVLGGKEFRLSIGGNDRWMRYEDLPAIQAGRREWEQKVAAENRAASGQATIGGLGFGVFNRDLSGGYYY